MKPHTRASLKTLTRLFYDDQISEICDIIDMNYTALSIRPSGYNEGGLTIWSVVSQLPTWEQCRGTLQARYVMQALAVIWGWYIGQYIIVRPVNVEEYR